MVKTKCEIYSRICGYLRPIQQWNEGKVEEFRDRLGLKSKSTKDDKKKK